MIPCVLFEDDHLLVVHKPAGLNTHSPSPYAGEGLYDWLKHRESRWANLAIIHRLDKDTSGVMVFAKSALANRSLTDQFTRHLVRKKYVLATDRHPNAQAFTVSSNLVRMGNKYHAQPGAGKSAVTHFEVLRSQDGLTYLTARPLTGRTHQIRAHAASQKLPILGDVLYEGSRAERLFLHAEEIAFQHPLTLKESIFTVAARFAHPWLELRQAIMDSEETNAYRLIHGSHDGLPNCYLDRLGNHGLIQSMAPLSPALIKQLADWLPLAGLTGASHKILDRHVRQTPHPQVLTQAMGIQPPGEWIIRENALQFLVRSTEGYSVGLFLDQRDNRRRLLTNHIAAQFPIHANGLSGLAVLNLFAYTCAFSVCAAKAGAKSTSIDLSRKYLEWGKQNFTLNNLPLDAHEFLYGDVFDWLKRLQKKQRRFDVILVDPPTFSSSKVSGVFRVEKDYGHLITQCLPLLRSGGILFVSTNAANIGAEHFVAMAETAIKASHRSIQQRHFAPQPIDFPIHPDEPAYLKTIWFRLDG